MTRTGIIAAMAAELSPLVRGWQHEVRNGVALWRRRHGDDQWVAACAGIGATAAARAFAELQREGRVDRVFSVGWAGALREELAAGNACIVSGVIDAGSGERFEATGASGGSLLVSCETVADVGEKRRLAAVYGAGLVDMEAAAVARLAAAAGASFYCVKGISDNLGDRLPAFDRFVSADGSFQLVRFVRFAAVRPWHWRALLRLARNSSRAADRLQKCLLPLLNAGRDGQIGIVPASVGNKMLDKRT